MRFAVYAVLAVALVLGAARAQTTPALEGWSQLMQAVRATSPNSIQALNGRQFVLRTTAATKDDALQLSPADAFRIERIDTTTFRVTVSNAAALFEAAEDIQVPKDIGWQLMVGGIDPVVTSLEGTPYCSYLVRFRQKGGNELDLSKYGESYRVNWEFNNIALVDESSREAAGIRVLRAAPGTGELKIRLRISRTTPKLDIGSDWVSVPHCATPVPEKRVVREESADTCIQVGVRSYDYCKDRCGAFSFTAKAHFQNVCSRRVKCTDLTWTLKDGAQAIGSYTMWIDLYPGQEWNHDVPLSAAYQPAKFSVNHGTGTCSFN